MEWGLLICFLENNTSIAVAMSLIPRGTHELISEADGICKQIYNSVSLSEKGESRKTAVTPGPASDVQVVLDVVVWVKGHR